MSHKLSVASTSIHGTDAAPGEVASQSRKQLSVKATSAEARNSGKRVGQTKAEVVLKKLRLTKGATLDQLVEATGWQAHSVRGFLSGTVKKKLGLKLTSETGKDGARRYRIDDSAAAS